MKRIYLILAILGFAVPNLMVLKVSIETGNILLWYDLKTTFSQMFQNDIASTFAVDLLLTVLVFFVWTYVLSKKEKRAHPWKIWILTMLFGLARAFPLFLYLRENQDNQD